jgi:hypothetical protein
VSLWVSISEEVSGAGADTEEGDVDSEISRGLLVVEEVLVVGESDVSLGGGG